MGVAGREFVRELRRDGQQRLLVEIRARDRQHQVGGARPQRGQHHAGLAAELAVDGRRDAGIGLVTHQHEVDAHLAAFVDQDQHFSAGQAEHPIDARIRQRLRNRRRSGHHAAPVCPGGTSGYESDTGEWSAHDEIVIDCAILAHTPFEPPPPRSPS